MMHYLLTAMLVLLVTVNGAWAQAPVGAGRQGGPAGRGGQAQPPGPPTLEQVTPNLYRAIRPGGVPAVTPVFVTDEGLLVGDTLSPEFAAWLRGELTTRFPGKPVRYVVVTHYHWDHSSGGGMFEDTATFVGHENLRRNLRLPIAQAPPPGDTTDMDGDNRLSREESFTATLANFDRFDRDKDGFLSAEEIHANVRPPDVVFSGDRHTLTLGGRPVELIWARNRHTTDMVDIYFPTERVLFAGDYTNLQTMCCGFAFDRQPMTAWIDSFKNLETLDFDRVIASHGQVGTKADLIGFRQYIEDLYAAVSEGIKAGRTVDELKKTVTLDRHKNRGGYAQQRETFIQSAYDNLTKYSR